MRLLCPWDFPGETTEAGCYFHLQEIFPTQVLNPHLHGQRSLAGYSPQGHTESDTTEAAKQQQLPHCRQSLYCSSHQQSPYLDLGHIKWLLENPSPVGLASGIHVSCTPANNQASGLATIQNQHSIFLYHQRNVKLLNYKNQRNLICFFHLLKIPKGKAKHESTLF